MTVATRMNRTRMKSFLSSGFRVVHSVALVSFAPVLNQGMRGERDRHDPTVCEDDSKYRLEVVLVSCGVFLAVCTS